MTKNTKNDGRVADAVREHWADRLLPRAVRPYARLARLERPIGWWLLLLPGWWAIAMAQTASGGGMAMAHQPGSNKSHQPIGRSSRARRA